MRDMDFEKLLQFASSNQEVNKKLGPKHLLNTKKLTTITTKKHEPDKKKGVNSAGVQAFLNKQKEEEKKRRLEEEKKKEELNALRVSAHHTKKANAMASRTKENYFGIDDSDTKEQFFNRGENDTVDSVKSGKNLTVEEKQEIIARMQEKAKRVGEKLTFKGKAPKSAEFVIEDHGNDNKTSKQNGSKSSSKSDKKKNDDNSQNGDEKEDKKKKSRKDEKVKTSEVVQSDPDSSSDSSSSDEGGGGDSFEVLGGNETKRHLQYDKHGKVIINDDIVQKALIDRLERKKDKLDKKAERLKTMDEKLLKLKHHKKKKHKKKHKHDRESNGSNNLAPEPKRPKIVKRAAMPNFSFEDILKKAAENRDKLLLTTEEVEKPVAPKKKKLEPEERPMTAEEKRRADRLKDKSYLEYLEKGGQRPDGPNHSMSDDDSEEEQQSKYKKVTSDSKIVSKSSRNNVKHTNGNKSVSDNNVNTVFNDLDSGDSDSDSNDYTKKLENKLKSLDARITAIKSDSPSDKNSKSKHSSTFRDPVKSSSNHRDSKTEHENVLVCGPRNTSQNNIKSSSNGSHKMKKSEKSPSPEPPKPAINPFDRVMNQLKRKNPTAVKIKGGAAVKKKKVIEPIYESGSEDIDDFLASESDDDDFIDDSEAVDVSSAIKSIFGYDKTKYKDEDEDLSNMDAKYADIDREEKRSAKLGRMEDLEDIRREEEEEKRKRERKKMKLKEKQKMKRH